MDGWRNSGGNRRATNVTGWKITSQKYFFSRWNIQNIFHGRKLLAKSREIFCILSGNGSRGFQNLLRVTFFCCSILSFCSVNLVEAFSLWQRYHILITSTTLWVRVNVYGEICVRRCENVVCNLKNFIHFLTLETFLLELFTLVLFNFDGRGWGRRLNRDLIRFKAAGRNSRLTPVH